MTTIRPNCAVTDVRQSPNQSEGRPAGDPTVIVIHHWGADGQTHQGVVDYLCRSGGTSSAHYVASAGRVTQLVSDRDRAWHAGPTGNPRGIGIECRPEMSDGDLETVATLIAAIRSEHGHLPIRAHRDYMSTACPGRWYAQLARLSARADAIAAGIPASTTATTTNTNTLGVSMSEYTDLVARITAVDGSVRDRTMAVDGSVKAIGGQVAALSASIAALTAAVETLSKAHGLDPATITASVQAAVDDALKGITVTLTNEATK